MSSSHAGGGRRVDLVRVVNPLDQGEDEKGGAGRRAAAEVFPRESKKALLESAKEKGLVKDSRFVRESELGGNQEGPGGAPREGRDSRPLADILLEQREVKQAKFEEGWKVMKTGKNRPLDEEEAGFLEQLLENEAHVEKRIMEEEKNEIQAFREAAAHAREKSKGASVAPKVEGSSVPSSRKRPSTLLMKERIKVCKPESKKNDDNNSETNDTKNASGDEDDDTGGVLQSLLGGYGSE
ncbi:hypothetical protein M9435_000627 [Picochlorum sp. BPE23]|nr:hypothetical protein M9435_000627 [Picochlorum sp. BPE23]